MSLMNCRRTVRFGLVCGGCFRIFPVYHRSNVLGFLYELRDRMLKSKTSMAKLVQYVVMRHDIAKDMQWPLGAVIAQACHATTAVMEEFKDDPDTIAYLSDIGNMHKVVLQVANESALMKAAAALEDNDIKHVLWIERPENMPTCIAIKPYNKEVLKPILGKYKLYDHTIIDI